MVSHAEVSEEQQGGVRCVFRFEDVALVEEVELTRRVWTRRVVPFIVPLVFHGARLALLRASGDSTHKVLLAFHSALC